MVIHNKNEFKQLVRKTTRIILSKGKEHRNQNKAQKKRRRIAAETLKSHLRGKTLGSLENVSGALRERVNSD